MSTNNGPNRCTTRFKGVENFLRRVAFNLGNTPSQTEVKIISCIPIDVTDLQQKIINLEKQLNEARARGVNENDATACAPAVHAAPALARTTRPPSAHAAPTLADCRSPGDRSLDSAQDDRHIPSSHDHYVAPSHDRRAPSASNHECECYISVSTVSDAENHKSRGLFKKSKKKKSKKKVKPKTQLVYYAQTTTGPFDAYLNGTRGESPARRDDMSGTYISDVIRKQYAPVTIGQELSTSQFSSPVCRDVEHARECAGLCESDVCSCCCGAFQNVDRHMATHDYTDVMNTFPAYSYKECGNNSGFYDSSLYDMVPVRDKPARTVAPCYDGPKRKVPRNTATATYRPQRVMEKTRLKPVVINYFATGPTDDATKAPVRFYSKREKTRRESPKREENRVQRLKRAETSNTCSIDCGSVYVKHIYSKNIQMQPTQPKLQPVQPDKSTTCKNAECLTNILNDTECQTTTTQSVQIDQDLLEEKKTEETLNQIKTILQSVLTEVKTNKQLQKTPESKDKATKDAVVQKGTSQGHMPGGSSLLNSFTYSPYNMDPYMASCSRQMNSGPYCYQNLPYPPAKCMQHFPVFIQTPGRHMCSGCYRNSSHTPKVTQRKPAATTATNTDSQTRSKETEKLIKEIYKSMAVNVEFPPKDTSASECNYLKSTPRVSVNKSLYRPSGEGMRKMMNANASKNAQKSATPITALNSKLASNTLSMRSQIVSSTDTERNFRNRRIDSYLDNIDAHRKRQNKIEEEMEYNEQTQETTASDEEASSSDASVRETYVQHVEKEPVKKRDKKGLFSKLLKSVFHGKSKNINKEEPAQVKSEVEEESDGDSDDYQTIYSQRIERRPRYVPRAVRSPYRLKTHSKISYSRHMRDRNQERSKRPPYMEQEYRRHWNEKLVFNDNRHRYSSDSPYSKETHMSPHSRDAYYRNYEARNVLVNQSSFPNPIIRPKIMREDILRAASNDDGEPKVNAATKGLAWLKKHKLGIRCGEQWKKFILEG